MLPGVIPQVGLSEQPATRSFVQYQEVTSGFTNPFTRTYTIPAPTGPGRFIVFGGYFRGPSGNLALTSVTVNGEEVIGNKLNTGGSPYLFWARVPTGTSVSIVFTASATPASVSCGLWVCYNLFDPVKLIDFGASSTNNSSVQTVTLSCAQGGLTFALSRVTSVTARGHAWTNVTERWDEAAVAVQQSSGADAANAVDGTINVQRQLTGAADTSTDWWALTIR